LLAHSDAKISYKNTNDQGVFLMKKCPAFKPNTS
jgi:hypothetical protein